MQLTKEQSEFMNRRRVVVLATASLKAEPNAILVDVNKAEGDEIVITDNEMVTAKKHLLENGRVVVLVFKEDFHRRLKIKGEAKYYTEGEYFDFVKKHELNESYSPKGAVVIKIREISDLK